MTPETKTRTKPGRCCILPTEGGEIPVPRTRIVHQIVALSSLTGSKTTKKARANEDGWG